jgi:hypothetical protein
MHSTALFNRKTLVMLGPLCHSQQQPLCTWHPGCIWLIDVCVSAQSSALFIWVNSLFCEVNFDLGAIPRHQVGTLEFKAYWVCGWNPPEIGQSQASFPSVSLTVKWERSRFDLLKLLGWTNNKHNVYEHPVWAIKLCSRVGVSCCDSWLSVSKSLISGGPSLARVSQTGS